MARALSILMLLLLITAGGRAGAQSLRFYGHGVDDIDRVKIRIDDPDLPSDPGPPVDVGLSDFTIEFFMRGLDTENDADPITCGGNYDWINGNIVLDRDRFNQGRAFGLSIAGGLVTFGIVNAAFNSWTLCSTSAVLDDAWHHVAIERSTGGGLWLYVDGNLESQATGPGGDASYPDDGYPNSFCGESGTEPCLNSDPFVVLAAEKHDAGSQFPSFSGYLDELRFSTTLRYGGVSFTPPTAPFVTDAWTAALYHFDEASAGPCTGTVSDSSGAAGGPSDGVCNFGGSSPSGPVYSASTPFPVTSSAPGLSGPAAAALALGLAAAARRVRGRHRRLSRGGPS